METVYALANNTQSKTNKKVIVTIKLLKDQTDMTSFIEDIEKYRHNLMSDFYFEYKINAGKIVKITSLDGHQVFLNASINFRKPTKQTENITLTLNDYFQIKHYDYAEKSHDSALRVFKYKLGVLNHAKYVPLKFSGVLYYYLQNGKIDEKNYYNNGKLLTKYCYYNNKFNTLKTATEYSDNGHPTNRYFFDIDENMTKRQIFRSDGKLFNTVSLQDEFNATEYKMPSPLS